MYFTLHFTKDEPEYHLHTEQLSCKYTRHELLNLKEILKTVLELASTYDKFDDTTVITFDCYPKESLPNEFTPSISR
jgi:hypothetical protein